MDVPSKTENRVTIYGLAISLLGIHPEKIKILIQRYVPSVHNSSTCKVVSDSFATL